MDLMVAIRRYHAADNNLPEAVRHLETLYHRHFKLMKPLDKLRDQLCAYAAEFTASGNTVIKAFVTMRMELTPHLELGGEIGRVDAVGPGQYSCWMFIRGPRDWRAELRMPLLQLYCAQEFGVPLAEVSVGVYDFSLGRHEATAYTSSAVEEARGEAIALLSEFVPPVSP